MCAERNEQLGLGLRGGVGGGILPGRNLQGEMNTGVGEMSNETVVVVGFKGSTVW